MRQVPGVGRVNAITRVLAAEAVPVPLSLGSIFSQVISDVSVCMVNQFSRGLFPILSLCF